MALARIPFVRWFRRHHPTPERTANDGVRESEDYGVDGNWILSDPAPLAVIG